MMAPCAPERRAGKANVLRWHGQMASDIKTATN